VDKLPIMKNLENILQKENFTRDEIITLLGITNDDEISLLREKANKIRLENCGNEIHIRALLDFSNYCEENCAFCELREDNFSVNRYRLNADEIIEIAKKISNLGFKTLFLQSGEDSYYDPDIIAYVIYTIKQQTDLALTLNIGPRNFDDYRAWRLSGADRYFLKFYTSNSTLYAINHKKKNLYDKISHLKFLKRIGYQIGTGNIIGLPHQTIEDIADDILLCKELDVDMVSFAPFLPHPFTPYQNKKSADIRVVLNTISIARILMKNVHIHAGNALDTLSKDGRFNAIKSGANIIVSDLSGFVPNKNYGKIPSVDNTLNFTQELSLKAEQIGLKIASSYGNSLKMSI